MGFIVATPEQQEAFNRNPDLFTGGNVTDLPPELGSVPEQTREFRLDDLPPDGQQPTGTLIPAEPEPTIPQNKEETAKSTRGRIVPVEREGEVQAAEGVPVAQGGWWERPRDVTRAFLQGLTFNMADEFGAAIAAATATAIDGADYGETYSDMLDLLAQERKDFSEDHPGASIGANIAGGILSPANVIGGAALTGKVANVGKLGKPLGALAEQTAKIAPKAGAGKLALTGRAAGVATVEGAIAGAAGAKEGERLQGAGEGAAAGLATSAAFSTVGAVAKAPFSRKVAEELRKDDGTFTPLNLAAKRDAKGVEKWIQMYYQRAVGGALGGANKIREQSQATLNRARLTLDEAKQALNDAKIGSKLMRDHLIENANRALTIGKRSIAKGKREETAGLKGRTRSSDDLKAAAKEEKRAAQRSRDAQIASELDVMNRNLAEGFRRQAIDASTPARLTKKERERLGNEDPQGALDLLNGFWANKGFGMTKNRQFRVNKDQLIKSLTEAIQGPNAPYMSAAEQKQLIKAANEILSELNLGTGTTSVAGSKLTDIRSAISSRAAQMGSGTEGRAAIQQAAMRNLSKVIDDTMYRQLSDSAKKAFDKEKESWRNLLTLRGALGAARNKSGEFDTNDWRNAGASVSPRATQTGKGPLQKSADAIDGEIKANDKVIRDTANRLYDETMADAQSRLRRNLENLRDAQDRSTRAKDALTVEGERLQDENFRAVKEANVTHDALDTTGLEAAIEENAAILKELESMVPRENMSIFERMFATHVVGAVLLLGQSLGSQTATGVVGAPLLATQNAQRAVAGQLGIQVMFDKYLRMALEGTRTAERATARAAAGEEAQ